MGFCLSIIKTGKRKNTQKSKKARKILNELNRFDDHKISNDLFQLIFFMAIFAVCCPFNLITYISEIP